VLTSSSTTCWRRRCCCSTGSTASPLRGELTSSDCDEARLDAAAASDDGRGDPRGDDPGDDDLVAVAVAVVVVVAAAVAESISGWWSPLLLRGEGCCCLRAATEVMAGREWATPPPTRLGGNAGAPAPGPGATCRPASAKGLRTNVWRSAAAPLRFDSDVDRGEDEEAEEEGEGEVVVADGGGRASEEAKRVGGGSRREMGAMEPIMEARLSSTSRSLNRFWSASASSCSTRPTPPARPTDPSPPPPAGPTISPSGAVSSGTAGRDDDEDGDGEEEEEDGEVGGVVEAASPGASLEEGRSFLTWSRLRRRKDVPRLTCATSFVVADM
jgi:IS5 family transposase